MYNHAYRIQLYKTASCPFEFDFKCSEREAERLFYALAFSCTNSDIVFCRLYRREPNKLRGHLQFTLVNQFDTASVGHMLTNWLAEHILVGR